MISTKKTKNMRKITLILVLISVVLFVNAQSVTKVWENSRAADNLPELDEGEFGSLAGGGTVRKIAVGDLGKGERVYVLYNGGKVMIFNAENGEYVGLMNGSIEKTALLAVGDLGVTEDGKLLVSNVSAHNASSVFEIYLWTDEDTEPVKVAGTAMSSMRYGDNIFVEGNYSAGTAKVYATRKVDGLSNVLCWSMVADAENPGNFVFDNTPAEVMEVTGTNKWPGVTTAPNGYCFKDAGTETKLNQFDANGSLLGVSPEGVVSPHGNVPRFVTMDGEDQIVAYYRYLPGAGAEAPEGKGECRAELLRIPNGDITQAVSLVKTPSLGTYNNFNGWGALVVKVDAEGLIDVYVFSTTNGFGRFKIDLDGEPDEDDDPIEEEDSVVTTLWEHSQAKGSFPASWTYRKIAVGDLGNGERVFAAHGNGVVKVYNAEDGTYVKDLTGSITKTALLAIGDLGATEDGKLLVSNVSAHNAANSPFQIYMWSSEDAAPVKVLETRFDSKRFGDNIFVEGNYDEGTAKVYATLKINYDTHYDVLCWSMEADGANPGKFKFKETPAVTINVIGGAIQWAGVSTFPGGYYYKDGGNHNDGTATRLQQFDEWGDWLGDANPGIVTRHSNTPRFVGMDGDDHIVALFRYHPGTATSGDQECRAEIFRIPEGNMDDIESIALTPSLGTVSNANGWGDIVTQMVQNDEGENEAILYVSSVANGFGKYRIKLNDIIGSTPKVTYAYKVMRKFNQLVVEGIDNPTIEIYNIMGQKVKSGLGNTLSIDNLSGIFVISIKDGSQALGAQKFVF